MGDWVHNTLMVRGKELPVRTGLINVADLRFFVENPRIYSIVWAEGGEPAQESIYDALRRIDHVKELKQDIQSNGGLIDPVIVRERTMEVLEGNRRLAAYKMLAENNGVHWGQMKATLLPEDVSEADIYALLGQFHIKGKVGWVPYEQAGFLYRRFKRHDIAKKQLATEVGLSSARVGQLIATYELMLKHEIHDVDKWSYFEEYRKSSKIQNFVESFPEAEERFVNDVRTGAIEKAVHVREKMSLLHKAPPKVQKAYASGQISLDVAYERTAASGGTNVIYRKMKTFRDWLTLTEVTSEAKAATGTEAQRIRFEIKKISTRLEDIKKSMKGG